MEWEKVTPDNLPPLGLMVETKSDEYGERILCRGVGSNPVWRTGLGADAVTVDYSPTHWRYESFWQTFLNARAALIKDMRDDEHLLFEKIAERLSCDPVQCRLIYQSKKG